MAIEHFSNGYYKTEMSVQPYKQGPTIERGLYDFIARKFYSQTDTPVTMRVGLDAGPLFRPSAESSIPKDVLGLPLSEIEASSIHPSDDSVSVFVLKPEFAYLFNSSLKMGEQFIDSSNISDNTLSDESEAFFNLSDEDGDNSW